MVCFPRKDLFLNPRQISDVTFLVKSSEIFWVDFSFFVKLTKLIKTRRGTTTLIRLIKFFSTCKNKCRIFLVGVSIEEKKIPNCPKHVIFTGSLYDNKSFLSKYYYSILFVKLTEVYSCVHFLKIKKFLRLKA